VPAAVRAGQGHRDVVIAPALLHLEVGAADRGRPGTLLQSRKLKEIMKKCQWALIPRYPSHIASNVVGVLDRQTYQGGTRGSRLCGEGS
jgi:hypothetical protein